MRLAWASLFVLAAMPAKADWQYTKWGMTRDQVIAAGNGKVAKASVQANTFGDDYAHGATAAYNADGLTFEARFFFDRDDYGLEIVDLVYADKKRCGDLLPRLENAYGAPLRDSSGSFAKWRDEKNGNQVMLSNMQTSCTITYSRLKQPGEDGGL